MAYQVLARRYRPQTFDEVIGQEHVTRVLSGAIAANRVAHGYLFTGPRGVGKTSTARILAKALNCEEGPSATPCNRCRTCEEITAGRSLDVLEIDGASSGGIDQVRELRENARYAPASGQKKLYIIDEVHQVTAHGFNALLKTLEEPPSHVVFVLATTEAQKVPDTIVSRVQRFDFRRLTVKDIEAQLLAIVKRENFPVDSGALRVLSQRAQGSLRDAEVLLDQVVAAELDGRVNREAVERLLGLTGAETYLALSERLAARDARGALAVLDQILGEGANLGELAQGWIEHLRHLLLLRISPELISLTSLTEDLVDRYREQLSAWTSGDLARLLELALAAARDMRRSEFPRVHMELALVEMAELSSTADLKTLLDRIDALPRGAEGGAQSGPGRGGSGAEPRGQGRGRSQGTRRGARAAPAERGADPASGDEPPSMPGLEPAPMIGARGSVALAVDDGPPPAARGEPSGGREAPDGRRPSGLGEGEYEHPEEPEARTPSGGSPRESEELADRTPVSADPRWARVVERIRIRKTSLAIVLAEARRVELRDDVLHVGFSASHKFHREKVFEARNHAILGEEVRNIFGPGVRVRPMDGEGTVEETSRPASPTPSRAPVPARYSAGVERIVERFDGVILD